MYSALHSGTMHWARVVFRIVLKLLAGGELLGHCSVLEVLRWSQNPNNIWLGDWQVKDIEQIDFEEIFQKLKIPKWKGLRGCFCVGCTSPKLVQRVPDCGGFGLTGLPPPGSLLGLPPPGRASGPVAREAASPPTEPASTVGGQK